MQEVSSRKGENFAGSVFGKGVPLLEVFSGKIYPVVESVF